MHTHVYVPSRRFEDYEYCRICGTYHSTALMDKRELYEDGYWSAETGHSSFPEQIDNITKFPNEVGVSKIDYAINSMQLGGKVLEIGCAPGVLLNRARRKGMTVIGIEPDVTLIPYIARVAGLCEDSILHGYFPDVKTDTDFDYAVAMDVVEHVERPEEFILGAKDRLKIGGHFFMMSPIIDKGFYRARDFWAKEHAYIFSRTYIESFLQDHFTEVHFGRWMTGHECFLCKK
ncbi:MAG: hypothetical protein C5B59_08010 [Bacteroidetes bacterium]|nr:MAG: hypothetical protein C5B59_08010 [Bacteroidota bacterium]